jgi:hypothetical protein
LLARTVTCYHDGVHWLITTIVMTAATHRAIPERPIPLTIMVGQKAERDVGIAMGFRCDDLTVVEPEIATVDEDKNMFRVTGLKAGRTQCRVGLDPPGHGRPTYLFSITVTEAKKPTGK